MNAGQWKRSISKPVNVMHRPSGEQFQGYLREVRRSRYLVLDVPRFGREDWRTIIDRHNQDFELSPA